MTPGRTLPRPRTGLVSAAASVSASRTKPLPHPVTTASRQPATAAASTDQVHNFRSVGLWASYWTGIHDDIYIYLYVIQLFKITQFNHNHHLKLIAHNY